jgi:hypothetical protein
VRAAFAVALKLATALAIAANAPEMKEFSFIMIVVSDFVFRS